jgi:hypothetical protein
LKVLILYIFIQTQNSLQHKSGAGAPKHVFASTDLKGLKVK